MYLIFSSSHNVLGISTFCPWIEVNVLHPRTHDLGLTAIFLMQVHTTSTKVQKCTGFRKRTHFFGCTYFDSRTEAGEKWEGKREEGGGRRGSIPIGVRSDARRA